MLALHLVCLHGGDVGRAFIKEELCLVVLEKLDTSSLVLKQAINATDVRLINFGTLHRKR